METIKKQIIIGLAIMFSVQAMGQSSEFNKLTKAFKLSYEAEGKEEYAKGINELMNVYNEDSYEINLRLGWLNYLLSQHVNSEKYYQKAIKLKPFAIEPKLGLTYPVYATGNTQTLIELYDEILEIAPSNTTALYKLGLVYFYQKKYEEAEKYFSKIVNLYPFNYDALMMLANTSYHLKKFREAKVLYHKVLLYSPEDVTATETLKLIE